MKKIHAVVIAGVLGAAAIAGVVAATKTAKLGAAAQSRSTVTSLAGRAKQLDAYEASLRKALARKPPALPPVPVAASQTGATPIAQRVVYHRPPPIVVVKHRPGGEHEGGDQHESDHGGGDD